MSVAEEVSHRLQSHLAAVARRYPAAWRQVNEFRHARGQTLTDWPDWCFLPLAGAYAIVGGGRTLAPAQALEVGQLGALAAWRITKGIYQFDPTVFEAVWETPVEGEIPAEILFHLPEWCVYVPTPGKSFNDARLLGFFAHLEFDANDHRAELRFLLDCEVAGAGGVLWPVPLHLVAGGLPASLAAVAHEAVRQAMLANFYSDQLREKLESEREGAISALAPLVSLTLYLCAQAAEIRDAGGTDRHPARPRPLRTRKGERSFAANRPATWEVSYRLGAALRRAAESERARAATGGHAGPRPHIRRAHWATYWTGPRSEGQKAILKWIAPVAVNIRDEDDLIPTIRGVQ